MTTSTTYQESLYHGFLLIRVKTAALDITRAYRWSTRSVRRHCTLSQYKCHNHRVALYIYLLYIHRACMCSISLLPKPAIRVYRECTSIVKVAWFAVYIFGNLLVVVQKKGSRWLWWYWCIYHWCATSWATPKKHFVKNRQFLTDWIIRQSQNRQIIYLCNIYSIYLCVLCIVRCLF